MNNVIITPDPAAVFNVGRVTAYADAVKGGYQGTREEWERDLANLGTTAAEVEANRQAVAEDKAAVEENLTTVESYKNSAAQSASEALQSAESAHTDALAATAAKEAAQTAQGLADEARTDAVSAKGAAESAQTEANASATAATEAALAAGNAAQMATAQAGAASDSATAAAASAAAAAESARTLTIDTTLTQTGQAADAKKTGDEITDLKSASDKKNEKDMIIQSVDFTASTIARYISPSTNKWSASSQACGWMLKILDRCAFFKVKGGANSTSVAFLKTNRSTRNTTPDYATGETRRSILENAEYTFTVPDDANYVYIQKLTSTGTDLTPNYAKYYIVPNIVIIDTTLSESGKAADSKVVGDNFKKVFPMNLPYSATNGSYIKYSDGTITSGSNFAYTDYISIDGISKLSYSRIIVPSQYSPNHGIAFYNSEKTYISGIRSISKGNTSGYETFVADVPEGAMYVRCTIWNDDFSSTYNIPPFAIIDEEDYAESIVGKLNAIGSELSPMAIIHAVPQSEGVQNAILTARQFTDILWTPVDNMPGLLYNGSTYEYKTHKKGCRQKGIPYGSGLNYNQLVGDSICFDTFATAVKFPGSMLYTNNMYTEGSKKASYYGVACSKLVQACWGAPELVDSQQIYNLPGIEKIANAGEYTFDDIQLGDGVINPNEHCTIVTDILKSAVTKEIVAIEISEAVTPTCRRLIWSKGEFEKHFGSYDLYRYSYIDNAKYHKAKYIDLDDGYEGVNDIPIAIRRGSFINILTTTSLSKKADVDNTKWTTLHDVVNGVEQTFSISSSSMDVPINRTGYHEVYPTDANENRGNSSFYFVYDLSVSGAVSDGSVTVTYSITEGAKPWAIVFNQYHYTFLTEDTGTITKEIPTGMTSCYILFKSDYGTIKSSNISLT